MSTRLIDNPTFRNFLAWLMQGEGGVKVQGKIVVQLLEAALAENEPETPEEP